MYRRFTTVALASMAAWIAWGCGQTSKYPEEAAAIAVVQKLRGKVEFIDSGEERRVLKVYLQNTAVNDADLTCIGKLQKLRNLFLGKTQIGDDGLNHLRGLSELQTIALNSTRITDAGLKFLAEIKTLKTANLQETQVTDEGLSRLRELLPDTRIAR